MKIAVLADTHDNLNFLQKAFDICKHEDVRHIFHCGDWIAPFTAKRFNECDIQYSGVLGNNDGEREGLCAISKGRINGDQILLTLDKRRIYIIHDIQKLSNMPDVDVLLYGHTHVLEIKQQQPLLLNPGECAGWLTGRATMVILDISSLQPQIIELGNPFYN